MTKKILAFLIITSQLAWNFSGLLEVESWATEEQTEQDFSKEADSKKEKEINLGSFFRKEITGPSLVRSVFRAKNAFNVYNCTPKELEQPVPLIKIPLYLLQSCIRI